MLDYSIIGCISRRKCITTAAITVQRVGQGQTANGFRLRTTEQSQVLTIKGVVIALG